MLIHVVISRCMNQLEMFNVSVFHPGELAFAGCFEISTDITELRQCI